jgi:hypothetical protein
MEKKYLIVGMAVLLGVSLSFLACEDKAEEAKEPTPAELAAALAETLGGSDVATVKDATVTLKKAVTLSDEATVAAGVTLATGAFTLNVTGTINVDEGGEIKVASSGSLKLDATASGVNNGTISIASGAEIRTGKDHIITGSGFTVVKAGGKVYFSGKNTPFLGTSTDSDVEIVLESGEFSYKNGEYILAGEATLKNFKDSTDSADLYLSKALTTLTIKRGGVFTVETGVWLSLTGGDDFTIDKFENAPLTGDLTGSGDAPKIVIEGNGEITMASKHTYCYFYANGYSGTAGGGARTNGKTISAGTYVWTDPVVTSGTFAGWKATE